MGVVWKKEVGGGSEVEGSEEKRSGMGEGSREERRVKRSDGNSGLEVENREKIQRTRRDERNGLQWRGMGRICHTAGMTSCATVSSTDLYV
jgi:hypothetical protein